MVFLKEKQAQRQAEFEEKKAKKGIATPQQDIELIKSRLRDAELHYRAHTEKGGRKS